MFTGKKFKVNLFTKKISKLMFSRKKKKIFLWKIVIHIPFQNESQRFDVCVCCQTNLRYFTVLLLYFVILWYIYIFTLININEVIVYIFITSLSANTPTRKCIETAWNSIIISVYNLQIFNIYWDIKFILLNFDIKFLFQVKFLYWVFFSSTDLEVKPQQN